MKKRFDASGYSKEENRSLPITKNKKVIDVMKDEKVMTEFVTLRAKMYTYKKIDRYKKVEEKPCRSTKSVCGC